MKIKLPLTIALFMLFIFESIAQQEYLMSELSVIKTSGGKFYDDGGSTGNVGSKHLITTFTATSGYLELWFTEFNIPFDAGIAIYDGADVNQPPIGVFTASDKPWSFKSQSITIEYFPSPTNTTASGWAGIIQNSSSANKISATMPESDCDFAIPLCANSTANTSANQYSNTGLVNDDAGSCYSGTGSGGSVWYTFTPQTNGMLDFAIAPVGSTDYDFVLWDITGGCSAKIELSCNYSATHGTTGMNSTGTTSSESASGVLFCQKLSVLSSKKYALCINYYSGNNDGFQLTFKNETGDVNIVDATPPTITNAYANNCTNATQIHLTFSEWVQCNTVIPANIIIAGHTIGIVNNYCSASKTTQVDISVSPALTSGTYTINGLNIADMCGNLMNSNYNIVLGVPPIATVSPGGILCRRTNYLFGIPIGYSYSPASIALTANNTGGGVSAYIWSGGHIGATNTVTPGSTTTYTVTVTNGGCSATLSTVVTIEPVPTPNLGPDILMCNGLPMTLATSGGASYQWQVQTGTTFLFNTPTFTNIAGATGSSYSTIPVPYGTSGATYYQVIVTSPSGCTGSDQVKITFGAGVFGISANKPFLCQGESVTLNVPGGITAYTWNTGTSPNAPLTVTPAVTTSYTVTSTTVACPGTAVIAVPVRPLPTVSATALPNTACPGVPVKVLSGLPSPSTTTLSENFEGATHQFTLVNGTYNKWYHGTAAKCGGTKGLYVGTAAANNNYTVMSGLLTSNAATNHAYIDLTVTSFCYANLSFNWQCGGNANAALSVWIVPTSVTPVAGTAIVASATNILAGGPFFGAGTGCNAVSINMLPYTGQTVRVVFSWVNTGGLLAPTPVPPAAMIDDFTFVQNDSYAYDWTSTPTGFTSGTQNTIANPTSATVYNLTVIRCDGCINTVPVSVGNCTPLTIDLLTFHGFCTGNNLVFEWTTASENNNQSFTLEKSKDGIEFFEMQKINGAGNSSVPKNYKTSFDKAEKEYVYFRLKHTDINGDFGFSKIIKVDCLEGFYNDVMLFPNPADNVVNIKFLIPIDTEIKYEITDVFGRVIFKSNYKPLTVSSEFSVDISGYENGVYFIQINQPETGKNFPSLKVMKQD